MTKTRAISPSGVNRLTQAQFVEYAQARLNVIMTVLATKGQQYSKDSAFANFEEGSLINGQTPGAYLMSLATKHWHNLCKNPTKDVLERTTDTIIYMLLLQAMYDENLTVDSGSEDYQCVLSLFGEKQP